MPMVRTIGYARQVSVDRADKPANKDECTNKANCEDSEHAIGDEHIEDHEGADKAAACRVDRILPKTGPTVRSRRY